MIAFFIQLTFSIIFKIKINRYFPHFTPTFFEVFWKVLPSHGLKLNSNFSCMENLPILRNDCFCPIRFSFSWSNRNYAETISLSAWLLYMQHIMGRSTIFKCSNMEMRKGVKENLCMIFWCITSIVSVTRLCGYTLHGKPYFLFPEVLKR